MIWASVPEAPIDEDGDPELREGDVDPDTNPTRDDEVVLSKAQPSPMEGAPKPELRPRVRPTVRPPDLRRRRVGGLGVGHHGPNPRRRTRPGGDESAATDLAVTPLVSTWRDECSPGAVGHHRE